MKKMETRRKDFNKLFVGILLTIITITTASADLCPETYTVNMRDVSHRLIEEEANAVFIGDSITVQTTSPRIMYGAVRTWEPNQWRGIMLPSGAGVTNQGTLVTNEPLAYANKSSIIPGESFFGDGATKGFNVNRAYTYNFTKDFPTSGTLLRMRLASASFPADWSSNVPFMGRLIYLTYPNSTQALLKYETKNGTIGGSPILINFSSASPTIQWKDIPIPAATGTNELGFQLWGIAGVNESKPENEHMTILGGRLYRTDINTGLQLGQIGYGGFATTAHSGKGQSGTFDGRVVLANYTQETLISAIQAYELNTFILWIGQNNAQDEWNGISTRNYSRNVQEIITRYSKAYDQANISTKKAHFVLISTYDGSVTTERYRQMSEVLENITRHPEKISANITIGFVDLRNRVKDTDGNYTLWNATYLSDGVHPNELGALTFAQYMWEEIENAVAPVTANIGSARITKQSYTLCHEEIENGAVITNKDLYEQNISSQNLSRALIYTRDGEVICQNCMGTQPFSMLPEKTVIILNEFNITEGAAREESPLEIIKTNNSRVINSSLTETLETTVVLYPIGSCGKVAKVYDRAGDIQQTFKRKDLICNANRIVLKGVLIEPANKTDLVIDYYFPIRAP